MRKILMASVAAAAMALTAASAHATVFTLDSYTITANIGNADSNSGLTVDTKNLLNTSGGLDIDLGATNPQTFDLFKIYTPESSVNQDDQNPVAITVSFDFSAPTPNTGGTVGGATQGNLILYGFFQDGSVNWNGDGVLNWTAPGYANPGVMDISLSDGSFDTGILGLHGGSRDGYVVQATFDWQNDPNGVISAGGVPEPATWALMIGGFGLAGASLRRRRASATVA
jgi:hypothetical protein